MKLWFWLSISGYPASSFGHFGLVEHFEHPVRPPGLVVPAGPIVLFCDDEHGLGCHQPADCHGDFLPLRFSPLQKGNAFERFEAQRHVGKILLLDRSGFCLLFHWPAASWTRLDCGNQFPELWCGFGWAVIAQGIFFQPGCMGIPTTRGQFWKSSTVFEEGNHRGGLIKK